MTKPRTALVHAGLAPAKADLSARTDTVLLHATGADGAPRVGLYNIRTVPSDRTSDDTAVRASLDLLPRDEFGHCLFTTDVPMPIRPGGLAVWPCRLQALPTLELLLRGLAAMGREILDPRMDGVSAVLDVMEATPEEWHRISLGDAELLEILRSCVARERLFRPLLHGNEAFQIVAPLDTASFQAAVPGWAGFTAAWGRGGDRTWAGNSSVRAVRPDEYARFVERATEIRRRMPAARTSLEMECGFVNTVMVITRLLIRVTAEAGGVTMRIDLALE